MENQDRLLYASTLALFIHLFFFGVLYLLTQQIPFHFSQTLNDRAIKVEQISQAQLQRYRRAGVRGGNRNFMMPSGTGKKVTKSQKKSSNSGGAQGQGQGPLSLKQLQVKPNDTKVKKLPTREEMAKAEVQQKPIKDTKALIKKEIQAAENGIPLTALRSNQAVDNFRRQKQFQTDMMRSMGTSSTQAEVLNNTGFNLHFEPPEGIPEDELNSAEKIFYSFQKRTFMGYVNSFLSSYQSALTKHPAIQNALTSERHLLTGRITFDKEGNIVRIKILRSSANDEIHRLFEETLLNIRSLPNPPQAIIEDKDEFNIYYQLRIN